MGLGSIKAAAEHADFDLSKVITWTPGSPVPFGFLADTFEAIAEESKVRDGRAPGQNIHWGECVAACGILSSIRSRLATSTMKTAVSSAHP